MWVWEGDVCVWTDAVSAKGDMLVKERSLCQAEPGYGGKTGGAGRPRGAATVMSVGFGLQAE